MDKRTLTGKGGSNFLSMFIVILGFNQNICRLISFGIIVFSIYLGIETGRGAEITTSHLLPKSEPGPANFSWNVELAEMEKDAILFTNRVSTADCMEMQKDVDCYSYQFLMLNVFAVYVILRTLTHKIFLVISLSLMLLSATYFEMRLHSGTNQTRYCKLL